MIPFNICIFFFFFVPIHSPVWPQSKTACFIKIYPKIKGISINNSEFLISQYADDSTLSLADDENSLNEALNMISLFSICSGLRANFDKTRSFGLGPDGAVDCVLFFLSYHSI
jgi:hypothetical protein